MKRILVFIAAFACLVSVQAQSKIQVKPPRPKVGVVLCGGGAKGASHIGVLKYMEEMGIPVDYVAGTSMGAIIGGLYAAGYTPDELTELISNMDWSSYIGNKIDRTTMSEEVRKRTSTTLINLPFGFGNLFDKSVKATLLDQLPKAYVNNNSLVSLFNNLCIGYQEEMDFNDMPIPFACVATDIVTGNEVVLRGGSLPTAMRASMAIPGVFAPVQIGDMILVDGGLVNNFPVDVVREMGADIVIGVEITSDKKVTPEELNSLPQLLGRLFANTTSAKRKDNREMCNIRIVPDVSGFGMLSFMPEAISTLVARGYAMASSHHDQFQAIKDALEETSSSPVVKELRAPRARNLANDSVFINSVEIAGVPETQTRWLIRKGHVKPGMKVVEKDIEHAINIYRGTGCFDDITYTLKESDSLYIADNSQQSNAFNLAINMKPAYPHVLGIGMRYDTEEGAAVLLNFGLNEKKFGGSKLNLAAKLSFNPKISVAYTYSRPSLANFNLAYDYRNEHFGLYTNRNSVINLHYIQNRFSGYISQFHLLNFSTSVGASYTATRFDSSSMEEQSSYDSVFLSPNRYITPFVSVSYDNMDDAHFAKHGVYARFASHLYIEPGNTDPLPFDFCYAFKGYFTPNNGKFTIIPQVYGRSLINGPLHFNIWNQVGGEIAGRHFDEQLPFIGFSQLWNTYDQTAILRCDLRYNIYGKHYLTAMYNAMFEFYYLGEGNFRINDFHGAGLKYSYNSLIGPISLTGQWSSLTRSFGAYFSIGYTF